MEIKFDFSGTPEIFFGAGRFSKLPDIILKYGKNALIIVSPSFRLSKNHLSNLEKELESRKIIFGTIDASGEPTVDKVDKITNSYNSIPIDVVVAIGGGSVIDTGKAVSAMLYKNTSVLNYLEGIGTKKHSGEKIPFIAVPATAGTGSEATKNAVLSKDGYKKSLRHQNFIPDTALIDPELTFSLPTKITAYAGLDCLTQLIESYVSVKSSVFTDSLAESALKKFGQNLTEVCFFNPFNIKSRTNLSYAALISGITLANAGLGIIHGFAGSIGGLFDIPHGVICGTLLGKCTKMNTDKILAENNKEVIIKYSNIYKYLSDRQSGNERDNCYQLAELLDEWIYQLGIPTLGHYGIREKDFELITERSSIKENPVQISKDEMKEILSSRL